ncbi:unnamed protein product [Trichobilharzia szidati]|nr:unnamed protein product [Trichobilharzia szidati]
MCGNMFTTSLILIVLFSLHEPCSSRDFHWANETFLKIVDKMQEDGYFTSNRVRDALKFTDPWFFVKDDPYAMREHNIGYGAKMGAPTTNARVLEALQAYLKIGSHALDIETSGGYLAACMSLMVSSKGTIVATSSVKQLTELSESNVERWLNNSGMPILGGKNAGIFFTTGDPLTLVKVHNSYAAIYLRTIDQRTIDYYKPLLSVGGRMAATHTYADGKIKLVAVDRQETGLFKQTVLVDEKHPDKVITPFPPSIPSDLEPGLFDPDYIGYTSIQVRHIPDKSVSLLLCITIILLMSFF